MFKWNFNTHVATSNHQTVRHFQDVIDIVDTFLRFDLREDLDIKCVLFFKEFTNVQNILRLTNEGCSNKVNAIVQTKTNIVGILLCDTWQVDRNTRCVDPFLATKNTVILNNGDKFAVLLIFFGDLHVDQAIIEQNVATNMGIIIKTRISNGNLFLSTLQACIHGDTNLIARMEFNLAIRGILNSRPNFGTLCIKHDTNGFARDLFSFVNHVHPCQMLFMITM